MSPSDAAIKGMDLARSITDIHGKGGAVSGLVGDVVKWLARERINEADFTSYLSETRALLYPNSKGLEIQSSLRKSAEELKRNPNVAGVSLLGAGNIGRWMAQDAGYCYLATTVATLLIHHDMSYAADAICDMVLLEDQQVDGHSSVPTYALRRFQLRPVLGKIVESITLNVVNCGHDLGSLPPQLSDICGHTCDVPTFATVTMALAKSSGNLIIRCKKLLVDVFVWSLSRIEGNVELSIIGQIVHREKIGSSQRYLLFLVDEDCSCDKQQRSMADQHTKHAIAVSKSMGGDLRTIFEWNGVLKNVCGNSPHTRAVLYDVDGSAGCSLGALLPSEKRTILQVSQKLILCILEQPAYLCSIGRLNESIISNASNILIGDLLNRWPRICNESYDRAGAPATLALLDVRTRTRKRHKVLYELREARAIMVACSSRCSCPNCAQKGHPRSPFRGCLKAMAQSTILRMIAHAIADGFGADSASGMTNTGLIEAHMPDFLVDLLHKETIAWERWFGLAASVYLGLSHRRLRPYMAIQYGSLVVAAPWINLHNQVHVAASFGFESAQARIRGIEADWAVLCTESTARSSMGTLDLSGIRLPQRQYYEADVVEISLQSTIQSTDVPISRYRGATFLVATVARIGKYTRIIDPADIFGALSSSHLPRCSHDKSTMPVGVFPASSRIWTSEEAVGFWEASNVGNRSSTWTSYTTIFNSHAKYNTLLILSPHGCIVKTADCCFACAQKELDTRFRDSKARRVLSIAIDEERLIDR
ncbi:hypothetical protein Q7P35_001046 [Cladosporium inversicolor]